MLIFRLFIAQCVGICVLLGGQAQALENKHAAVNQYADAHFHISNYAIQGMSLKKFIDDYMRSTIARAVVMPIPLHQKWDYGEHYAQNKIPPNYYLGSTSELYYYSFVDALVAKEYQALSAVDKKRVDPMITGFNPMDGYASQHIKRVLLTFPGVFSGIGEFTVHKEIVSRKVAGETVQELLKNRLPPDALGQEKLSLYNPSLVDIFNTVAEIGLVATLHNDIYQAEVDAHGNVIKKTFEPHYVEGLTYLCKKSPHATVIWAHTGLGRFVEPMAGHLKVVGEVLDTCSNWSVDISWDLVQEAIVHPKPHMPTLDDWIQFIIKYQDRVLWGSDAVIYSKNYLANGLPVKGRHIPVQSYYSVVDLLNPLLDKLDSRVAKKIRLTNYLRLFNGAQIKVRAWEKAHRYDDVWDLPVVQSVH